MVMSSRSIVSDCVNQSGLLRTSIWAASIAACTMCFSKWSNSSVWGREVISSGVRDGMKLDTLFLKVAAPDVRRIWLLIFFVALSMAFFLFFGRRFPFGRLRWMVRAA